MSQFILQLFFCFSYVTSSSLNSPGELPMIIILSMYKNAVQHGLKVYGSSVFPHTEAISKVMHTVFFLLTLYFIDIICSQSFNIVSLLLSDQVPTFGKHYYSIQGITFVHVWNSLGNIGRKLFQRRKMSAMHKFF